MGQLRYSEIFCSSLSSIQKQADTYRCIFARDSRRVIMKGRLLSLALVVYFPLTTLAGEKGGAVEDPHSKASAVWSPEAAARYLDSRAAWWQSWPKSQRDHETVCVSCHTMLPYAL